MRIFDCYDAKIYSNKINFVDDNNVLVGFDFGCQCCEEFGYRITTNPLSENTTGKEIRESQEPDQKEYIGFNFDPKFREQFYISDSQAGHGGYECAMFKLLNQNEEVLYLTLWNSHNGYYSHGFEMVKDEQIIFNGDI